MPGRLKQLTESKGLRWLAIVGAVLGACVAAKQLGFVLPHEALARQEAAQTYETQNNAALQYDRIDTLENTQQKILLDISNQLGHIQQKLDGMGPPREHWSRNR